MRVMTWILKLFIGNFLVVYFDDILVYNETKKEHLDHISQVLLILKVEKLYVNLEKCSFM